MMDVNKSSNDNNSRRENAIKRFSELEQPKEHCLASYIWLDSSGLTLRYKTRTFDFDPVNPSDIPWWDCAEAWAESYINTDVFLEPVKFFNDPFYAGKNNKLVLCESYCHDKSVANENKRHKLLDTVKKILPFKPLFIIEQKYKMFDKTTLKPIDQLEKDNIDLNLNVNSKSNPYYCSIGSTRILGRNLVEAHLKTCLYSGVNIKSYLNESLNQWRFEIGPCEAVDLGDHLWMARFLLHRIAEDFDIVIRYDTSTMLYNNESMCTNLFYSIQNSQVHDDFSRIALDKLNKLKLTDRNDNSFSNDLNSKDQNNNSNWLNLKNFDISNSKNLNGYLEFKRPYSNFDPYELVEFILRSTLLD